MPIHFFNEDIKFKAPKNQATKAWLKAIAFQYQKKIGDLNYIFCDDEYILNVNIEYLAHDYYTDIITFDNSEEENILEGDIFVSIDRVQDNAQQQNVDFENEWRRVLVHGLLHLIGFDDQNIDQKAIMRQKENEALTIFEQKNIYKT